MIREFITGKIESISKIYRNAPQAGNGSSYRIITLDLPAKTDLEKRSPDLFENSLQDAIIDGVMTSDEAEAIRIKANKTVQPEIIFYDIKLLEKLKETDLVYIIAEPYNGKKIPEAELAGRVINQGIFITKDVIEFQKEKMNVFRDMEKERQNWRK